MLESAFWGCGSSSWFRRTWVRRPWLSQLMPVSSTATATPGFPRVSFQAPAALKPEICAFPSLVIGLPGSRYLAVRRVRSEAKPNRSKRSEKRLVEVPPGSARS